MSAKGATTKSYIPIESENLRNAIMATGRTITDVAKSLGYKFNDWTGYLYNDCAMPQDLFFKIIDELEIAPEDIASKDHEVYGRSWDSKQHMIASLRRIYIRLRTDPYIEMEFVEALAKFAPYLVPKAVQQDENYTPERWAASMLAVMKKVESGEEPETVEEQMMQEFTGD